jgi:hypothetical protein
LVQVRYGLPNLHGKSNDPEGGFRETEGEIFAVSANSYPSLSVYRPPTALITSVSIFDALHHNGSMSVALPELVIIVSSVDQLTA